MRIAKPLLIGAVALGVAVSAAYPVAQDPAPAGGGRGRQVGPGPAGRGRGPNFPQQQRPLADAAVLARGKGLYEANCSACHGIDLRGGQQGGSNLLRSQLVLSDKSGELITPVVQAGRPNPPAGVPPMPAFPLPPDDIKAIAEYLHSVLAQAGGQGRPPEGEIVPPEKVLVGDAAAGQAYFAAKCSSCHSTSGDLKGLAARVADPRELQNLWVSGGGGGRGGRGGGRGGGAADAEQPVKVMITPSSGARVEGRLVRMDDFTVVLIQDDGARRTFVRKGNEPKVEVRDPSDAHRTLANVSRSRHAQRDSVFVDVEVRTYGSQVTRWSRSEMVKRLVVFMCLAAAPVLLFAQQPAGLDPISLLKPLGESWPTYSGDYTGRRYSSLTQINQTTVKNLGLAWMSRGFVQGSGPTGRGAAGAGGGPGFGGGRGGGGGDVPLTVAGEATGEFNGGGPAQIRGSILMVDGVLYATSPDNLWAVDARDGTILWQFYWKTRGGTHTGHRGVGMWRNYLFMETHDDYLVKIDARTGKEVWHVELAPFEQQYFSSMAPIIIGDHVIVGTGNDLDAPGYLQSYDPETGKRQWIFYTVPMHPGDPGLDTWPSLEAARHGGGQPWVPGVYDPETRLYIFGTGNPTPAYTVAGRGTGVGLFTCSLVAVNVDTGRMAWYYQTSPRDMHDWDSAQTPVLIDATINGRPRELVSTAARNGYFFTMDRVTGEYVASGKFGTATNWASGLDSQGRPILNPEKVSTIPGAIVSGSTTNWPPPAYSPETGLFYVPENNGLSITYLIDADPRGSMGLGGRQTGGGVSLGSFITAIDPKTAKIAWRHKLTGGGGATGMLTTAGRLLFAGDGSGNLVAFDPADAKPLWHSRIGNVSNAPQTYMLDGKQYILVAAGDALFAFALY